MGAIVNWLEFCDSELAPVHHVSSGSEFHKQGKGGAGNSYVIEGRHGANKNLAPFAVGNMAPHWRIFLQWVPGSRASVLHQPKNHKSGEAPWCQRKTLGFSVGDISPKQKK